MERQRLSDEAVEAALAELNRDLATPWEIVGGRLHKLFLFRDFVEAFGFMMRVAPVAEALDHHPDWCNQYRRVEVSLTTHEVGGLTEDDFALAHRMDALGG